MWRGAGGRRRWPPLTFGAPGQLNKSVNDERNLKHKIPLDDAAWKEIRDCQTKDEIK